MLTSETYRVQSEITQTVAIICKAGPNILDLDLDLEEYAAGSKIGVNIGHGSQRFGVFANLQCESMISYILLT